MILREIGPFELRTPEDCAEGWWHGSAWDGWFICPEGLAEWFEIDPHGWLWVQVHDRPAKNRLKVVGIREDALLVVQTKKRRNVALLMAKPWRDLDIPYPYYVEILQEQP
jgi:hypothetical protein